MADSRSMTTATSEADATTASMSMIGLAASPGTDVLPTCSIVTATPLSARRTRSRKRSN